MFVNLAFVLVVGMEDEVCFIASCIIDVTKHSLNLPDYELRMANFCNLLK